MSVFLGRGPEGVGYDPVNHDLYAGLVDSAVAVVTSNNDSVTTPITGYASTWQGPIAFDAPTGYMYLSGEIQGSNYSSTLSVLEAINSSTNRVAAVMNVSLGGAAPMGGFFGCLTSAGPQGTIYACDTPYDEINVINGSTDTLQRTIPVGTAPYAAVFDPATDEMYVANWGSSNVSIINMSSQEVVGTVSVGEGPLAIALDPNNGYLYVASSISESVSVINSTTHQVVATVGAGCHPQAAAFDPLNQEVFVANNCDNDLTVINTLTDTNVGTIPVGFSPDSIAYDPADGGLYVADYGSLNLTALFLREYPVTFNEHGLPGGTSWSVQVGATFAASASGTGPTPTLIINEPNGSFEYGVSVVGEYWPSPGGGQFDVAGSGSSISILFAPTVLLTFSVTGLPSTQYWKLNITNTTIDFAYRLNSTGPSESIHALVNESYNYSVTFFGSYSAWDTSGEVVITDHNVTIVIPVGPTSAPPPAATWPWEVTIVLVAVVAAIAIALAVLLRRRRATPPSPPPLP